MNAIEVDAKPNKIHRVGKFDDSKTGSRPLKVCFENQAGQQLVMNNKNKLQNAPENVKHLSVCYDLNEEERNTLKTLVQQANEQSKNSQSHIFRVRGPPGGMKICRFPLRKTPAETENE